MKHSSGTNSRVENDIEPQARDVIRTRRRLSSRLDALSYRERWSLHEMQASTKLDKMTIGCGVGQAP